MRFRHRHFDGIAIHGGGGRIYEPPDLVLHTGLQHIESTFDVDVKSGARKVLAVEQPHGRQMDDGIGLSHGLVQDIHVADIAAARVDRATRVREIGRDIAMSASREVVVDDDLSHIRSE
jgi:hypothetical protein